jgi:hypothetical protein
LRVSEPVRLVTMRLVDMHKVHPQQDNTRVCALCGETVGLYPSGQKALREHPKAKIICQVCAGQIPLNKRDINAPAASWAEIVQEMRDSTSVKT